MPITKVRTSLRTRAMVKPGNINRFVSFHSLLSVVIGLLGLAGCYLHMPILRTILPGMVAIAANTSACFVLLGVSLWWLREPETLVARSWTKWLAKLAAAAAAMVGFLSLVEYLGNLDFGIDQLIFIESAPAMLGHVRPGLMSPITALDLVLLGSALLLLDWVTRRRTWPAQVLCFIAGILAGFTLVDMIVDQRHFQAHIALSTVTVLAIFPFAVICARPKRALGGLLVASGSKKARATELFFPTSTAGGSGGGPVQYALAVILVAAATLLRHWLAGYLPPLMIFLTYYPAVMVSALSGGLGPGVLATLLAATCANYFFLAPVGVFTIANRGNLLGLLMFIGIGLTISWLASALEQTREEATAALRQNEAHLREAQRIARLGSWALDVKTGAVTWSEELYRMFRLDSSVSAIPYQEQPRIFTPESWSRLSSAADKTVRTGEPYELELETVLSDGAHGWMMARGEAQRDASGEVATLRGVALDITEQRQSQQKLREQAALLDLAHDAIFVRDLDSRIVFWNYGAQALYGWSAEEAAGKISHDLLKSQFPQPLQTIEAALQQTPSWEGEITHTNRDGKAIVAASRWSLLRDEKGNPTAILEINRDVTERKRAESALRESEGNFRTLANFVPQMVWMCNPDGLNIYFNRRWFDYTGLTPEESQGWGWSTPFHPDDRQAAWEAWRQTVATGETYQVESRLRASNGSYRWFLMRGTPLRDESGKIVRWFGTCTDIDDMKRSEAELSRLNQELDERVRQRTAELEAANNRLGAAQKAAMAGIWNWDVAAGNLTWSPELFELFGLSASEQISFETWERIVHPEDWQGASAHVELAIKSHKPLENEYRVVLPGGEARWIRAVGSTTYDENGGPQVMSGICLDISDRKRAEEALRDSEELLRAVTDNSPDAIYVKDRSSRWLMANPAVLRIVEKTAEQALGKTDLELYADAAVGRAIVENDRHIMESGTTESFEEVADTPDGRRTFLSLKAPRRDAQGNIVGLIGISRDITARKLAEVDLQRRTAELEAANRELEAFTYSIAHDLRAPLRHLSGFSKIVMADFASCLPEEAQRYIKRIDEGTCRMGTLLDDLLNLARIGRKELGCEVCGLRSILDQVILELKPEYENRQVEWTIGALPFLACDPGLVKQVFTNLLANALKFTRPRERAVIEIGQQEDGAMFVRDNGVGFSMKYADKLFGVFQRLHRVEDFEGTGVGLATVQRIIQKHGGRIWARAELDKGAVFYFTLAHSEIAPLRSEAATAGE